MALPLFGDLFGGEGKVTDALLDEDEDRAEDNDDELELRLFDEDEDEDEGEDEEVGDDDDDENAGWDGRRESILYLRGGKDAESATAPAPALADEDDDGGGDDDDDDDDEGDSPEDAMRRIRRRAMRKLSLRLLPCVFLARYVYSLDKVNLAFASVSGTGMQASLELDEREIGLAMSSFYAAGLVMQLPMSLLARKLGRFGIPITLALVSVTSAATAASRGLRSLCALRAVLGIAESAVLPLLLSQLAVFYGRESLAWAWARTGVLSGFVTGMTQGPLAAIILKATERGDEDSGNAYGADAVLGLEPWQWLFVVESVPTLITAVLFLTFVPRNAHACAGFLRRKELAWLVANTEKMAEAKEKRTKRLSRALAKKKKSGTGAGLLALVTDARVAILFATSLCASFGSSAIGLWMPSVISNDGRNGPATVALLRVIPSASATVCLLLWARRSDARGERVGHASSGLVVMGVGLLLTALSVTLASSAWATALQLFFLSIADAGIGMFSSPFDALQGDTFPVSLATAAMAIIAIAPNVGGLIGPFLVGALKESYDSFVTPIAVLAAVAFLGALILLLSRTLLQR